MHYTFENRDTGEQKDEQMTIAEMEYFITTNPQWFVVIKPLGVRDNFVASRYTNIPTDGDFKSLLKNMSDANPRNTINY